MNHCSNYERKIKKLTFYMFTQNYQTFVPFLFFIDKIVAYVRKDGIPEKLTSFIRILRIILLLVIFLLIPYLECNGIGTKKM